MMGRPNNFNSSLSSLSLQRIIKIGIFNQRREIFMLSFTFIHQMFEIAILNHYLKNRERIQLCFCLSKKNICILKLCVSQRFYKVQRFIT